MPACKAGRPWCPPGSWAAASQPPWSSARWPACTQRSGRRVWLPPRHSRPPEQTCRPSSHRPATSRDDVAPDELASYCLHALTAASSLPSQAAIRRLVTVISTEGVRDAPCAPDVDGDQTIGKVSRPARGLVPNGILPALL